MTTPSVDDHFNGKLSVVRETYGTVVQASQR